MVLSGVGLKSSVGLVAAWSGGGMAWCRSLSHGDGSIDGSLRRWFCSLTAMGLLMGLARWLMGFEFNGFWDRWLWVPMGFMQQWRSVWIVDRGQHGTDGSDGVQCGGSDGFRWGLLL